MSLHKLTAGDGYTYLTRQVAVHDATDRGSSGLAEYYDEKGESPGRWWGSGLAGVDLAAGSVVTEAQMKHLFGTGRHPLSEEITEKLAVSGIGHAAADRATRLGRPFIKGSGASEFAVRLAKAYVEHNKASGRGWSAAIPAAERSAIRTRLAEEMFAEEYGRRPSDVRERHAFIATASRDRCTTVAGFDLTFTPVKSVSVLWALADETVALAIAREHAAAVQDTLAWAETNVLFTRRGHNGVRQVATRGLLAAAFTHRDSRAGDPNLHTHVAVSNKVQDLDGNWLAVDARPLFKANVTLSEHYNTRLEARLRAALGLRFEAEPDQRSTGRVVREVVGVDRSLIRLWSARRAAITTRLGSLVSDFATTHQRPPTPVEAIALAQQANLETRQAKHSPRSEHEQRAQWRREATGALGSELAIRKMVAACLNMQARPTPTGSTTWHEDVARTVVTVLEDSRATWQEWHVRAEVERQVRYADISLAQHGPVVDRLVSDVLAVHSISIPDPDPAHGSPPPPPALRRRDGEAVYSVHGDQRFTSHRILEAERSLLETAGRLDGPAVPAARANHYFQPLPDASAPDGGQPHGLLGGSTSGLSEEQQQLVTRLACSPQRLQVALAPAGTGKTTAMTALAQLWRANGGRVIGLAPSAAAAHQLSEALGQVPGGADAEPPQRQITSEPGGFCETLTKFVLDASRQDSPAPVVDTSTLVIIDEAAMAGTVELAAAVQYAVEAGATVRLLGDDRQLTSVGAGGIVRDLAEQYGAATLTTTRRFVDPIEGEATLALREGDPLALGFYADHGRWHVGDLEGAVDLAYDAWRTDLRAGLTSVLLAPTRDLVASLNIRAQAEHRARRAHPNTRATSGRQVRLHDGSRVGVGDMVLTRHNDRRLRMGPTRWVKNGDRWQVTAVHPNGHLTVRSTRDASQVRLSADYVTAHVELGYATTVHGAQGISVDTAHLVLTGQEDRSLLYVGLTRGRLRNSMYVAVLGTADPGSGDWHHLVTRPETLRPPTGVEVVRGILAREPEQASATSLMDPAPTPKTLQPQLAVAVDRYRDSLYVAAEELVGATAVADLERIVAERYAELIASPIWDTLRGQLLLHSASTGSSPAALLESATTSSRLHGARDQTAVIAARLDHTSVSALRPAADLSTSRRGLGSAGPLPWLPGIPELLQEHPVWGAYLQRRAQWVTDTSAALAQSFDVVTASEVPMWARGLAIHADPTLLGDLAIWRAAEGVNDEDLAATGTRPRPGIAGDHQSLLQQRVDALMPPTHTSPLPDEVLADVELPHLVARLEALTSRGVDTSALLDRISLTDAPLPTELAAAALWWRLRKTMSDQAQAPVTTTTPAPAPDAPVPDAQVLLAPTGMLSTPETGPGEAEAVAVGSVGVGAVDPGPDPRWSAPGRTSRDRVVELHHLAADYYRDLLGRSWAEPYLASRLLLQVGELPEAGYAPPGPTSLLRHLEALGAHVEELLDAGLVKATPGRDGRDRVIDCFRDRLVFPIHDPRSPEDVVGFVGRRNPVRDEAEMAGPKYLNTRSTVAYAKSDSLFGLEQLHRHPSARLALVEGPLDALAITRATSGSVVGVAVLGAALTLDQARLLVHAGDTDRLILTAFDGDEAGTRASQACLTTLRQVGVHGLPAAIPPGLDPAAALQQLGPDALCAMLSSADDQVLVRSALSRDAASQSAGRRGAARVRSRDR